MADNVGNGDAMELPIGLPAVNRLIRENSHLFSDEHCKVCSAILISESQKLAHYQSKKHANKFRRYTEIHQGEDFSPAKKIKADDTLETSDAGDRNKCCPVCNMTFSSPVVATSHYIGKIHSKNLKLKEQGGIPQGVPPPVTKPAAAATATPPPGDAAKSDPLHCCQLCNVPFNNPHMAEQHYKGKKHRKQETKSEFMNIYTKSGSTLTPPTPVKPQTPGSGATANWFSCDTCNVVVNSIEQYQAHVSGFKHRNNLKAKAAPQSDTPDRKSYGGFLSSRMLPTASPATVAAYSSSPGGLLSSGRYSSTTGNFSSSYSLSNSGSEGLLSLPSYTPQTQQPFFKDMMGPDSSNYFSQDY